MKMSKVISVVDIFTFAKNCGRKIKDLYRCGRITSKQDTGINEFLNLLEMKVSGNLTIPNIKAFSGQSDNCMALAIGNDCLTPIPPDQWIETYGQISDYIRPPLAITSIGHNFVKDKMNNVNYLAIHWRFDSEWLDMCEPNHPSKQKDRNKMICKMIFDLHYDENVQEKFLDRIEDVLKEKQLHKIYFATTINNGYLTAILRKRFENDLIMAEDLEKFANERYQDYINHNYYNSLLEEYMCTHSAYFLGSPLSSWTQSVIADRLARKIFAYDSSLERLWPTEIYKPGFPPLVYQHVEGGFRFNFPLNEQGFFDLPDVIHSYDLKRYGKVWPDEEASTSATIGISKSSTPSFDSTTDGDSPPSLQPDQYDSESATVSPMENEIEETPAADVQYSQNNMEVSSSAEVQPIQYQDYNFNTETPTDVQSFQNEPQQELSFASQINSLTQAVNTDQYTLTEQPNQETFNAQTFASSVFQTENIRPAVPETTTKRGRVLLPYPEPRSRYQKFKNGMDRATLKQAIRAKMSMQGRDKQLSKILAVKEAAKAERKAQKQAERLAKLAVHKW